MICCFISLLFINSLYLHNKVDPLYVVDQVLVFNSNLEVLQIIAKSTSKKRFSDSIQQEGEGDKEDTAGEGDKEDTAGEEDANPTAGLVASMPNDFLVLVNIVEFSR